MCNKKTNVFLELHCCFAHLGFLFVCVLAKNSGDEEKEVFEAARALQLEREELRDWAMKRRWGDPTLRLSLESLRYCRSRGFTHPRGVFTRLGGQNVGV